MNDIQTLYVAYYGRPADPEGLLFWKAAFTNEDNPVDLVLEEFGESIEYQRLDKNSSVDAPIIMLYQQMFNREPDPEGLQFYMQLLESHSLASIALDIANGAQGQDAVILSNKVCVANTVTKTIMEATTIDTTPHYSSSSLEDARELLASVGASQESLAEGKEAAAMFVYFQPYTISTGECFDDAGETTPCPEGSIYDEYEFECLPSETPIPETDYLLL